MALIIYRRQNQILDYIKQFIQANGFAPTLKQIADSMGVTSLSTIHEHLTALEKKGLIKRKKGYARYITILKRQTPKLNQGVEVPILGYIAAGSPLEPCTDPNASVPIPGNFTNSKSNVFVLQVRGESMIDEQIRDGDYVVVKQVTEAKNGDIVVALLENGMATLKRFFKESTRIRLEPANSNMSPIFVRNVKIQGIVVGLIRKYSN